MYRKCISVSIPIFITRLKCQFIFDWTWITCWYLSIFFGWLADLYAADLTCDILPARSIAHLLFIYSLYTAGWWLAYGKQRPVTQKAQTLWLLNMTNNRDIQQNRNTTLWWYEHRRKWNILSYCIMIYVPHQSQQNKGQKRTKKRWQRN